MPLKIRNPLFSLIIAGYCLACSSSSDPNTPAMTGTGGTPAGGGTAGTTVGNAGAATGASGASSGGSGGSGGATTLPQAGSDVGGQGGDSVTGGSGGAAQGGSAGESAAGSGGAGGSAGASGEEPTNFTCTQVTGAMITGEWFDGGNFEDKLAALGGDPDKWEIKNNHYGTIEKWVNPTEGPIQTNDGDSYYWGKDPSSACAQNSNNPDRVIFTAISWEFTEEAQWVEALEAVVQNIKDKYSNIRWIELASHMRCPNNMMCNDNAVQGPGSDGQASLQDCYVWPAQDAAMAAVAAADPIVGLAPKFEALTCRPEGIDGAHLGSANEGVAQAVADWYAEHP